MENSSYSKMPTNRSYRNGSGVKSTCCSSKVPTCCLTANYTSPSESDTFWPSSIADMHVLHRHASNKK